MDEILNIIGNNTSELIVGLGIIIILLGIIIINQNFKLKRVSKKLSIFMEGNRNLNIEEILVENKNDLSNLKDVQEVLLNSIKEIKENLLITFQKVSIHKYDAFEGLKGKLSSVIVLLNKENTGFIINTIYNREGCYMYVKEVINGKAEQTLSDEEKMVLEQSL